MMLDKNQNIKLNGNSPRSFLPLRKIILYYCKKLYCEEKLNFSSFDERKRGEKRKTIFSSLLSVLQFQFQGSRRKSRNTSCLLQRFEFQRNYINFNPNENSSQIEHSDFVELRSISMAEYPSVIFNFCNNVSYIMRIDGNSVASNQHGNEHSSTS